MGAVDEKRRIIAAGFIYFAIVFGAGFVLGPVRVLLLEPQVGPTMAVFAEAPLLLLVMILAGARAPRWAGMRGAWPGYLAVGLVALGLQQAADIAVGLGLRGKTIADQLAYFTTPAGWIYAVSLTAFAIMPLILRPRGASVNAT